MDNLVRRLRTGIDCPVRWVDCDKVNSLMKEAADHIQAIEARIVKTDALAQALTQISIAPSEIIWGKEDEINATMKRMEAIADAALIAYREEN